MSSTPTAPSGQPGGMQPGEFSGSAPALITSWQMKRLPPPSELYITADDKLVVRLSSSSATEVVTVSYRLLRAADGVIVRGQFTVPMVVAYSNVIQSQQLAEGFLLSVSLRASVALTRGQTFARAFIGAGPLGAGEPSYMLMSDYVTTNMAPAFPNGRQLSPVEGPGYIHTITQPNPAVGVDWGLSNPPLGRYLVRGVIATLATNANVANRVPAFQVLSETLATATEYTCQTYQTAGQTETYVWSPAPYPGAASIASLQVPMPPNLVLRYPQQFQVSTLNLQAGVGGDKWTNISYLVEEWLDNV